MMTVFVLLWSLTTAQGADWHVEADRACSANVELCETLESLEPVRTRAGHFHFPGAYLEQPGADLILLKRLMAGEDSPEVRSALVPAIQPLLVSKPALAESLFFVERQAGVRVQLVGAMREASSIESHQFLIRASQDSDARVREMVASVVGFRPKDTRWLSTLEAMLTDPSANVRAMSARSLGWYGEKRSFQALLPQLNDDDASVRLQVLSALERIDADSLANQPTLRALHDDSDARIRHRVKRLVNP